MGTARRAGVLTVMAAAGVLGVAGPAFADVTVSPPSAVQGSGENLTFHATNTGTKPVSTVVLRIPDDTPVAEVYPLSVDDWAPKIDERKLSTPLATIHGGTPVSEATDSITWIAVGGKSIAPGGSADLSVAIGPLPTLSTMRFDVEMKYTDGTAAPASTATLQLTADPSGTTAAHAHGATATTAPAADDEEELFRQLVANAEEQNRGMPVLSIAGWVIAALALFGAGWIYVKSRHRAEEEPGEPDEDEDAPKAEADAEVSPPTAETATETPAEKAEDGEEKEAVAAGKWSLKN
ncbi:DUF1775 domain-containing protein [Actinoplanes sp. NPDC051851]|uniref:DUF1775 domain-containing protein n=1 Tax=Actinoplanes sp. NPDC051851 TaxID=3154753 RepID=UPI00342DC3FF